MNNPFGVEVGQMWQDNDSRCQQPGTERYVRVLSIEDGRAQVVVVDSAGNFYPTSLKARMSKIRLDRFKPTSSGYRRREDLEAARA